MKVANLEETIHKIKSFMKDRGVKVCKIDISEDDEGILIDVYTNLPSMKKATQLEEELWEIIPDEEVSILVYPAD